MVHMCLNILGWRYEHLGEGGEGSIPSTLNCLDEINLKSIHPSMSQLQGYISQNKPGIQKVTINTAWLYEVTNHRLAIF